LGNAKKAPPILGESGCFYTKEYAVRLDIAALSDIGRRKKKNEDSYGLLREGDEGVRLFNEGALLTVCDGLGGHIGGDIASKLAVSIVKDIAKMPLPQNADFRDEGESLIYMLRSAIERSNQSIYKTNMDIPDNPRPMGTTVLSCIVTHRKAYVGNLGDSRCYHLRDGEIIARTEDHSWVDEQVKLGLMSKAEAETDPRKNVVTRCAGTHPEVVVDTYAWDIFAGDMLLMCTDGLVNMVPDSEIKGIFLSYGSASEITQALVNRANENGGKDNITVIVTHINPSSLRMSMLRLKAFLRRHGLSVGSLIFLAVYGAICAAVGYALQLLYPLAELMK